MQSFSSYWDISYMRHLPLFRIACKPNRRCATNDYADDIVDCSRIYDCGHGPWQSRNGVLEIYFILPILCPTRYVFTCRNVDLPVWEPILSIAILLVTIFILGWFGARVYRGGVLMYGPSRSLKDIKKAIQLGKE